MSDDIGGGWSKFSWEEIESTLMLFCRYKILLIIGDNKMVDVDLRKLIFCFLIRMSDDGVGPEVDFYEYVRNYF